MEYVRFNKIEEVKNVIRGKKTKVNPYALLRLIADDYLDMHKKRKG